MTKITLLAQIINKLEKNIFRKSVRQHQSDKHSKGINSWTHLITMLFLHLSASNSLREISNGIRSATGNLNHLGVKTAPSKSSISYINEHRTWELFHDYYFGLLQYLSALAGFKQSKFRIKSKIYLIDTTIISLCLSLFDWAIYRKKKGAIKLHTVLDYDSCLPVYVHMSEGRVNDSKIARDLIFPQGSVVVCDRGYLDYAMLFKWTKNKVNFVTRLKSNSKFDISESFMIDCKTNLIIKSDENIYLTESKSLANYPEKLRRIVVYNEENDETLELLTNNFSWTANTIAELYKSRWQIEIFFKEIKQLLKIKSFVGTSPNAVLIQIWTAMISMLILKYLRSIGKHHWCLSNLIAFLRLNLFVKIDLQLWLDNPFEVEDTIIVNVKQCCLF